jgi:flavin reductase (DIM6/NTAB) family NADH-FMN oxidoreductase RutF
LILCALRLDGKILCRNYLDIIDLGGTVMQQEVEAASEGGRAMQTKQYSQIAVVLARDKNGKDNPITVGWYMTTSFHPPMLAISIGKTRYSCEVIRQAQEFVVALMGRDRHEDSMYFGTHSGRNVDKLKERQALTQPAGKINCVLLADANANFECRLAGELETGDHWIFSGEIVAAHVNTKLLDAVK